jgi:hypothetical protein
MLFNQGTSWVNSEVYLPAAALPSTSVFISEVTTGRVGLVVYLASYHVTCVYHESEGLEGELLWSILRHYRVVGME